MARENLIDLELSLKLLSFKVAVFRDLDHDTRVDLIDEGDASFPDPTYIRKPLLNSHSKGMGERFKEDVHK